MSVSSDVEWVLLQLVQNDDRKRVRRTVYRRIDPLTRVRVRKRVRQLAAEAALATNHAENEAHVHRCALLMSRERPADRDSVEAVVAAFEHELRQRPVRGPGRWLASALLLASCAGGWLVALFAMLAPDHWLDSSLEPISAHAFERGGRPSPGGAAERELFVEALPAFLIALDATRDDASEARVAALREAERHALAQAVAVLGEDATSFLRAICEQARALVHDPETPAADSFLRSVDAFNAAIEQRGLGYYLDGEVLRRGETLRVYLASFAVERVHWFTAGEQRVRALWLARRDRLNFVRGVLGMTRPHIRDALVLEERVDAWLISDVLPALVSDGVLLLHRAESGGAVPPNLAALERAAGAATRSSLAALVAPDCAALPALGNLFARRRAVFALMRERGQRHGLMIVPSERYAIDVDRYANAADLVGLDAWRELNDVARQLDDRAHQRCFRALRTALMKSIERHEVQHRLDFADGTLERLPSELAQRVGPLAADGLRNEGAERALAELSAHLSEVARSAPLAKVNLCMLAQHVLDRGRWGSAEYFAALVIFDGLVRELGGPAQLPALATDRVAAALEAFLAMDSAALATGAQRLWESLLGRTLPRLQVRVFPTAP